MKGKEPSQSSAQAKERKRRPALEELVAIEEEKKRTWRTDYWLQPEIIVKIKTKNLGEKHHQERVWLRGSSTITQPRKDQLWRPAET